MKSCLKCNGNDRKYNEQYDAYYCSSCYEWLEKACDDPDCCFCPGRPENAKDVD